MKGIKILLWLLVVTALTTGAISGSASDSIESEEETNLLDNNIEDDDIEAADEYQSSEEPFAVSLRGTNRFLGQKPLRAQMTCNKYPRICRSKGSPGPDCCKKKCVNVATDRLNCGMCGKKCKSPEICCKGKCVNPLKDKKNCGGCNNKCKKGRFCEYGMCSYA